MARHRYAVCEQREGAIQAIEDYAGDASRLTAAELAALRRPVILRGLAAGWPMVQAEDKTAYLKRFDSGATKPGHPIASCGSFVFQSIAFRWLSPTP